MSKYLFAAVLLGFSATVLPVVTPAAAAIEYPWCAQYGWPGGRNCGFSTEAQCMASVSGAGGLCQRNLFYTEKPRRR